MRAEHYATLGDVVRPRGGADRSGRALVFEGRELSYGELDARSNALAQALLRAGVRRADRVAVLSKNNLAYVELLFSIAKVGAVFVPLNWRLATPELSFIVEDAEPALVFVEAGLDALISDDVRTRTRIIAFDDSATHRFALELEDESADPESVVEPDDLAMLIYTSGTTGRPKGVMIQHANFRRHCDLDGPQIPGWMGIARDECCLNVLPLSAGRPTFDTELRILDAEGRDAATGAIGEIAVRSGSVMKGYWRRPEATAETIDANGWLRSGDAGCLDADGFVIAWARTRIASYKLPRTIETASALPKNATGKILRREVRARVHAQLKGS